jgi:hypothetical protein
MTAARVNRAFMVSPRTARYSALNCCSSPSRIRVPSSHGKESVRTAIGTISREMLPCGVIHGVYADDIEFMGKMVRNAVFHIMIPRCSETRCEMLYECCSAATSKPRGTIVIMGEP